MLMSPTLPGAAAQSTYARAIGQCLAQALDIGGLFDAAERLKGLKAHDLCLALYRHWIACNGASPFAYAAYFNYGTTLSETGDAAGAINAFREAIRLKPEFEPPHINLGGQLEKLGLLSDAVTAWTTLVDATAALTGEAIAHKTTALKQIGRVLEAAGNDAAAESVLHQLLEIDPSQDDAIQHWFALRQRQCKWPVLPEGGRIGATRLAAAISPLSAACHADDPVLQLATGHRYGHKAVGIPADARAARHAVTPATRRPGRLRVGYVSSDLRQHAVGFSLTDLFETHDRDVVEVFAYYCGVPAMGDPTQDRIKAAVEHWHDLTDLDDAAAAALVKAHAIDILVDLNGYTKDARTGVFARRPAPIQVNWFGFPGSMGSPYHHYIVADPIVIPPAAERFYSETVLRLGCYQPNDRKRLVAPERPSRAAAGLPEGAFVFCSLNGMQKIKEATFANWMTILDGVPNSVLWLLSGTEDANARLRAAAEQRGIAGDRLVFAGKVANPQHLARYPLADLFLDTFPYGSHTTAADALWMGVPILTRPGRSFASRVCASLVTAAGLGDLVCTSADDLVTRAVAFGRDRATLEPYRRRLTEGRDSAPLFDTPRLARDLEGLFARMASDFAANRLPTPDLANLATYHEIAADTPAGDDMSDAVYLAHYHARLAERHDTYPIAPDARLWPA